MYSVIFARKVNKPIRSSLPFTSMLRKNCGLPYAVCVCVCWYRERERGVPCSNDKFYIRANCTFVVYLVIPLGLPTDIKFL